MTRSPVGGTHWQAVTVTVSGTGTGTCSDRLGDTGMIGKPRAAWGDSPGAAEPTVGVRPGLVLALLVPLLFSRRTHAGGTTTVDPAVHQVYRFGWQLPARMPPRTCPAALRQQQRGGVLPRKLTGAGGAKRAPKAAIESQN